MGLAPLRAPFLTKLMEERSEPEEEGAGDGPEEGGARAGDAPCSTAGGGGVASAADGGGNSARSAERGPWLGLGLG